MDFAGGFLYAAIEEAVEETVLGTPGHPLRAALGRDWRLNELEKLGRDVDQDLRNCGCDPATVVAAAREQDYGRRTPAARSASRSPSS
jgi:hypothetical protein